MRQRHQTRGQKVVAATKAKLLEAKGKQDKGAPEKHDAALTKLNLTPEGLPMPSPRKRAFLMSDTAKERLGMVSSDPGQEFAKRLKTDNEIEERRAAVSPLFQRKQRATLLGFVQQGLMRPAKQLGMMNLGNTCYMNAVLQAILGLQPFVKDLDSKACRTLKVPPDGITAALWKCVTDHKDNLRRYDSNPINPAVLKSAVEKYAGFGQGGMQQDAHEFLCVLLQALQGEILTAELQQKTLGSKSAGPLSDRCESQDRNAPSDTVLLSETLCPVAHNFEFSMMQSLTCKNCGHGTQNMERYTHLSLELPEDETRPCSLPDLLKAFMDSGSLSKKCPECEPGESIEHSISYRFARLPSVLVLHIKRFKVSIASGGGGLQLNKLHTRVHQLQTLNISTWVGEGTLQPYQQPKKLPGTPEDSCTMIDDKENLEPGAPRTQPSVRSLLSSPQQKTSRLKSMMQLPLDFSRAATANHERFTTPKKAPPGSKQGGGTPNLHADAEDVELQRALLASMGEHGCNRVSTANQEDDDMHRAIELSLQEASPEILESPFAPKQRAQIYKPAYVIDEELDALKKSTRNRNKVSAAAAANTRLVLRGCISHKGETATAGHFIADVQSHSGWSRYDDTNVSILSTGDMLPSSLERDRESYLLFYTLQDNTFHRK